MLTFAFTSSLTCLSNVLSFANKVKSESLIG